MTLEERIQRALAEDREITKTSDFKNLHDFYEEMKKQGVAIKKEYNLPPLDTVGHRLHQTAVSKTSRRRK